jgi:hypothetical protein
MMNDEHLYNVAIVYHLNKLLAVSYRIFFLALTGRIVVRLYRCQFQIALAYIQVVITIELRQHVMAPRYVGYGMGHPE